MRKKYNLTFLHLELRGRHNPTHLSGQCKGDKSNSKMVVGVLLDVTMEKKENVFHYRFEGSVSRRKAWVVNQRQLTSLLFSRNGKLNSSGTAHGIQVKVCDFKSQLHLTLNHSFSVSHFPPKKKNTAWFHSRPVRINVRHGCNGSWAT